MSDNVAAQAVINEKPEVNKYMWTVFTLTLLGWLFDGMDQMIFAMVMPWIKADWKLDTVQLGLIGSFFLVGHAGGSLIFAYLADRYGRKPMLWLTVLIYSSFTGLTAFARNAFSVGLLRALAGLGTGGQWPVGISMLSENVPPKKRGVLIGFMNGGYPLGFLLAVALTGTIGTYYRNTAGEWGWRVLFLIGALPAVFLVFLMMKYLKESNIWLQHRVAKQKEGKSHVSIKDLFVPTQIRNTLTAIIIQISVLMCYWGVAIWAPTYLATERGLTIGKMTGFMAFWVFGAWIGQISGGYFNDKFGRKKVISTYLLGIAFFSALYGFITSPNVLFWVGPFCGYFVLGIFGPVMAYTPELFPTSIRATGVGLSTGMGRLGAIIAPTLVGVVAKQFGIGVGFYVFSAVALLSFLILIIVGRETKGIDFQQA